MKKILLVLAIGVFIGGCATDYQKDGFSGGFSETQMSGEYTSRQMVFHQWKEQQIFVY